jgi:cytochrome c oxidase subunit 3
VSSGLRRNPYQALAPSAVPFVMSLSLGVFVFSIAQYFHGLFLVHSVIVSFGVLTVILFSWFAQMVKESVSGGHTEKMRENLKIGMILFLVSEVMFFFSFFWGHFHLSLSPSIWVGKVWPPVDINFLDPFGIPFLNTLILLTSSLTVNYVHSGIINKKKTLGVFLVTLFLAFIFSFFQFMEYTESPFSMRDSSFSSDFYLLTGFHGIHVIIGTTFLVVCYILHNLDMNFYSSRYHLSFTFATWYWHFVDVIWLFLYLFIYIWGGY